MSLDAVTGILERAGVRYALIGALALAARGMARSTLDIDLLTADDRVLEEEFWGELRGLGVNVDVRRGDFDDPLRGVVRIHAQEPIDVVVAKYKWQRDVVERSSPVQFRGMTLLVPETSDLILLKVFAGGHGDIHDIGRLLEIGPKDALIGKVNELIASLPMEMQERWQKLVRDL